VGQVTSHRKRDRLDGSAALLAKALRLPRDGANRLGQVGDLQNHGASPPAGDHDAGDVRDLGIRLVASGHTGRCRLADGVDMGEACARRGAERISLRTFAMACCFQRR